MPAYLITGVPGTGKSTIAKELTKRGFNAYDTDMVGLAELRDRKTDRLMELSPDEPIDLNRYAWNWDKEKLRRILNGNGPVFLCGEASNQEEFYESFDHIFVLSIDEVILKYRLATRNVEGHEYGKHPEELRHVLNVYKEFKQRLVSKGAAPVDSTKPVNKILKEIINHILVNSTGISKPPLYWSLTVNLPGGRVGNLCRVLVRIAWLFRVTVAGQSINRWPLLLAALFRDRLRRY